MGSGRPRLRVVVADDDDDVRTLLRRALPAGGDIEVVGEAVDGSEAVELSRQLRPGAVVSDLRMPGLNGDEVLRLVRHDLPGAVLILCSANLEREIVIAAGADAAIDKTDRDWTLELQHVLLQEAWRVGPPDWPRWERRGHERSPPGSS